MGSYEIFHYDFLPSLYPGSAGGNTVGVAPCANIYGLKIFDDNGENGYSSYIVNALNVVKERHVANPNAKSVVSMSLSGYCATYCDSNPVIQLISTMHDLGILFAVAASNDYNANACLYFPAASPKAITVAASDEYDYLASYSNTGPCGYCWPRLDLHRRIIIRYVFRNIDGNSARSWRPRTTATEEAGFLHHCSRHREDGPPLRRREGQDTRHRFSKFRYNCQSTITGSQER